MPVLQRGICSVEPVGQERRTVRQAHHLLTTGLWISLYPGTTPETTAIQPRNSPPQSPRSFYAPNRASGAAGSAPDSWKARDGWAAFLASPQATDWVGSGMTLPEAAFSPKLTRLLISKLCSWRSWPSGSDVPYKEGVAAFALDLETAKLEVAGAASYGRRQASGFSFPVLRWLIIAACKSQILQRHETGLVAALIAPCPAADVEAKPNLLRTLALKMAQQAEHHNWGITMPNILCHFFSKPA